MSQAVGTTMTLTQAQNAALGFAIAQTAYAMNNAGGLVVGQPLQYIDDYSINNAPGASSLNLSIPAGYIVEGVYRDKISGADVFLAYSASDKKALIGVAGSNGIPNDRSDTKSDIVDLGTNQTKAILLNEFFPKDIERIQSMAGNDLQVVIAGQSLGGGVAKQIGIALVDGIPNAGIQGGLGFEAKQITVVSINGFGTELAYQHNGYSAEQVQSFAQGSTVQNFFVQHATAGTMDAVTLMGGASIGNYYALNATSDAANSLGGLHRFNFGVAEGLADVGYNFSTIQSVTAPTPLTHASITVALQGIDGILKVENNLLSLSANDYAAVLLSRPGETSGTVSTLLQRTFGMNVATSGFIGGGVEILGRVLPFLNPAAAAKVLLGSLGVGKLIGSEAAPAFEVNWGEVPTGFERTKGVINGVPAVIDSKDGIALVRFPVSLLMANDATDPGTAATLVITDDLRTRIESYRAKRHSKPCANESVWSQLA